MNKMKLGPKLFGGFAAVAVIAGFIGWKLEIILAGNAAATMPILVIGGSLLAIGISVFLTLSITKSLKQGIEMMSELLKGHLGTRLKMDRGDEIGDLARGMDEFADDMQKTVVATMKKVAEGDLSTVVKSKDEKDEISIALIEVHRTLTGLIAETGTLTKAAVEGHLGTRGKAENYKGGYREIVEGVNNILDAVIGPLNVSAEYVDKISKGNIPAKITDTYNGDFNLIKNNLNQCIDAVNNMTTDTIMLAKAAVEGRLGTRADATKHNGDYRKIVEGVNATLDSVVGPLNVSADYVDKISKGNIPAKITDTYNGDFNLIKNNLNQCIDAVNGMATDTIMLAKAAVEGRLGTRADATKHNGDYRKIVEGVNNMLDSVVGPLNVSADYVDKISKGNIPAKITDTYNGDFNLIKNNLNQCIDAVNGMTTDTIMLAKAAVEGRLGTRADATKHGGDYRKIVEGVNNMLDSVVGPINVTADYVDRISKGNIPAKITDTYNGDFNKIKGNLNQCIDAINGMTADTVMLVEAALDGRLTTRADATKHGGDFRKIVEGVNKTLDAVVGPVTEAADVLEKVAEKDMTVRVKGDYKGDLAKIKNSLNRAVDNLDQSLQQVAVGAEQVASASGQIGSGSQALAQGASEQASSLEEISSSLQEMTSMTKQNTANAREAKGLSDAAKKGADKGVANMKNLSAAVDKIKKSSDDTAKIVKTIDEIAFQTNLLALNAAVEAARAGDAGKGFAVVAEEVRNLAMRSAEAAKNTANMIEESVKNAENGVALNGEVMKNFDEITTQATKVSEVMAEIAAASEQQSQGIEQVTTAVQQMNQLTQQSAANSEESASAAEELSSQAQEMQAMVATFAVSGETAAKKTKPVQHAAAHAASAGPAKKPARETHKVLVAAGGHKEPASVIPFGDGKDGLKSF